MNVKFTGAITKNRDVFNSLLDGELITHNKSKEFVNNYFIFNQSSKTANPNPYLPKSLPL